MAEFSDYIVYVDESGDHSLTSIDPQFPAFALSFCIFAKDDYTTQVVPAVQDFKFKYWGHDAVVLHEHEIRKSKRDFTFLLTDRDLREQFYSDLTDLMTNAPFMVIGAVIRKEALIAKYADPWNPYEIALRFCMENLLTCLLKRGQKGKRVHVVFECRGEKEDRALELEFRRIADGADQWGWKKMNFGAMEFEPKFAKKATNSTGLQLADLTARPMAIRALRPDQDNRAFDVIQAKLEGSKWFP